MDSTSIKVTGSLKKTASAYHATKIHMVAASDRIVLLSAGEKHDAPQGRKLIERLKPNAPCSLVMDRAYEDEQTRALAIGQGFSPVVPPKKSRLEPWDYDEELYKRRNEVERLFRRIKRFSKIR